jgi:FkbH-like protein
VSLSPTTEDAHLVFLTLDFVSGGTEPITLPATKPEADPAPARRPAAKCVVFDLDNTLWDGVLVEGHVQLRPGVLDLFKALDQRGILISVASKNSHDEAIAELSKLGLEEYVLFPQISWGMKSSAIKEIAKSIDIGIDTLVFVDDSPFERAEVERTFPEVEVLPDTELPRILDHVRLQGSTTAEAASRRLMYRQSMARASASVAFGDDYMTFLRSCQIVLEIRPDRPADFERIAELVQRTNQLNFSGRKYSREEISAALADPALERYVLSVDDRFGSYGLVGFCMAVRTQDEVLVKDFMLSCRVQGKFVEQALFHHLTNRPGWTASAIAVNFKGTSRNRLAEAVLDKLGFSSDQGQPRRRPAGKDAFAVDFLEVRSHWFNMESESA